MTTVEDLAWDLSVDARDIRVLIEQMADLHDAELPPAVVAELRDSLSPHGERDLPRTPDLRAVAEDYRDGPDPALLDLLARHGATGVVQALTLERVLRPGAAAACTTQLDRWLDGGPEPTASGRS